MNFSLSAFRCLGFLLISILTGCATAKPRFSQSYTPQQFFDYACTVGQKVESVKGSVWMKAKSTQLSGQFPAFVSTNVSEHLQIEVTNLLGGTEALIQVNGDHYEITDFHNKGKKKEVGVGAWGGIPLRWATALFLGKIPCPPLTAALQLRTRGENELEVEVPQNGKMPSQLYLYRFKEENGNPWPEALEWQEKKQGAFPVEFTFEDPEKNTLSPQRWKIHSNLGEVQVRWKEREAETTPISKGSDS